MNEVQLAGWFATEAAIEQDDAKTLRASFIMKVAGDADETQFFRVICRGLAAERILSEASKAKLMGRLVALGGSLRQSHFVEGGREVKTVYVEGARVEFLTSLPPVDEQQGSA